MLYFKKYSSYSGDPLDVLVFSSKKAAKKDWEVSYRESVRAFCSTTFEQKTGETLEPDQLYEVEFKLTPVKD